jgi:ribonuclease Y
LFEAEKKARSLVDNANLESKRVLDGARSEEQSRRAALEKTEQHLLEKEQTLDAKTEKLEVAKQKLEEKNTELKERGEELDRMEEKWKAEMERVAQLSSEQAREMLLAHYEKEYEPDILKVIKKKEEVLDEEADAKAKKILAMAIQRYASEVSTESTATVVELPSDDLKGRIIGKEGRNITAFEQITGVDVIVDDTPGTIVISGFDLMRRYIAKKALEELVRDGRIHPARIEDTVEKVTKEVNQLIKESGEKACYELGITGFHPDLIKLIGRLRFRTSYGQNVLKHCVEVGFLAAAIAGEMGADTETAKIGGFLHDIGKAVDHEIEGTHALIGGSIARKFGIPERIINCIEAHHNEVPMESPEAFITAAADAISGSRPGARRESLENYIKRLKELESLANSFDGVKKSFAIQAGREIRVLVEPEKITDLDAKKISYELARKIEKELVYPGEVKITVIRESRNVEYAK